MSDEAKALLFLLLFFLAFIFWGLMLRLLRYVPQPLSAAIFLLFLMGLLSFLASIITIEA